MNAKTNRLGTPLPKGKLRFYRRNDDQQLEFTGEDTIDHTPRDEIVHVNTGNAFDLVGERTQTDFKIYVFNPSQAIDPRTGLRFNAATGLPEEGIDPATGLPIPHAPPATTNTVPEQRDPPPWINETFEIKLRNHKREAVEIRVIEHLYRGSNWEIRTRSDPFKKIDSQTIEFRVTVNPDTEKIVRYTVHYSW